MSVETTLRIEIAVPPGQVAHVGSIPLAITFRNGGTPVRILRQFEPLPVFFSFDMVDADGTPLLLPGGGKIDLRRNVMEYVTLARGETYMLAVDIHHLMPSPLKADAYTLSVTYHNQYGEDCFRGSLHSNTITVTIGGNQR